MKGNTLYIIGNGFDSHHDLNTRVDDFIGILKTHSVYNELADAEDIFAKYGVDWSEYENSLSELDLEALNEDNIQGPDYLSDHEYDRDGVIWNMESFTDSLYDAVRKSLAEMIENANNDLQSKSRKLKDFLCDGDAVLNFNYTSTVQMLYTIPDNIEIIHIHGYYKDNEEPIFGYKDGDSHKKFEEKYFRTTELENIENEIKKIKNDANLSEDEKQQRIDDLVYERERLTEDRDYYMDKQREEIINLYLSFKKELQIDRLKDFLNKCENITQVRVMGHSMADVDSDYMELVEEMLQPEVWYISQHKGSPSLSALSGYSFKDKIKFYKLEDFDQ